MRMYVYPYVMYLHESVWVYVYVCVHICRGAQQFVCFGNFIQKKQTFLKNELDVLEWFPLKKKKDMKNLEIINELNLYGEFIIKH